MASYPASARSVSLLASQIVVFDAKLAEQLAEVYLSVGCSSTASW